MSLHRDLRSRVFDILHGANIGLFASRFSRFRAPPSAILREKKASLVRMQREIRSAAHQ